jgi:hypothetical protein
VVCLVCAEKTREASSSTGSDWFDASLAPKDVPDEEWLHASVAPVDIFTGGVSRPSPGRRGSGSVCEPVGDADLRGQSPPPCQRCR